VHSPATRSDPTGCCPLPDALQFLPRPEYRAPDVLPWNSLGAGLLLTPGPEVESLPDFRRVFPEVAAPDGAGLVEVLRRADLRGRGGAGFPAWRKVEAVAARRPDGPVAVVANGEEGEPASCKDRYLLRHRPHVVLEGLEIVRRALDAESVHVYVSDALARDRVSGAIAERGLTGVEVFLAPRGYVSGEETAVVRALDGGPALPTQKPPRPFESGVGGRPTAVMNVETLARVCQLWTAEALGQEQPADLLLLTVLGPDGVVLTEVPAGTTLREVARRTLGLAVPPGTPVLAGGFFSGFLPDAALDAPLDFDGFRQLGTGVGCGSFIFLPGACPVDLATDVMAFFDRENAHQCGSCFKGTAAMHQALYRIGLGRAQETDVANLERWSRTLPGRGSCATLDGAACLARTLLSQFADVVDEHARTPCPQCVAAAERVDPDTRFRVPAP
jgi:NADH:ubiquinone oxidoreductase subunit F (NADH-binding)